MMFSHPKQAGFLISFFLLIPAGTAGLVNTLAKNLCSGGIYDADSTFQTNLNALSSSLITLSSSSISANATAGAGTNTTAYGLFLCEGDLTPGDCKSCIQTAVAAAPNYCPNNAQVIIWYDYCMVRYSDVDFIGVPDTGNGWNMTNPYQDTTSSAPLDMVSDLVREAPFRQPLMFSSKASASDNLYGMAQCTADLTSADCAKCLNTILSYISICCTKRLGWRYLAGSCWIRYEPTPFLQVLTSTADTIQYQCSDTNLSTASAAKTLDSLITNMTTKAQLTGFADDARNSLYALALCRADLATPSRDCNNCLDLARTNITESCPSKTEGIIWHQNCLLRYSNSNFFGAVDYKGQPLCNSDPISKVADDAILALASKLVGEAAQSPRMSAAGQVKFDDSTSSYVLLQCTRDLNSSGCKSCLDKGIDTVTKGCKQINGWRYLSGSCTIRSDDTDFFNITALAVTVSGPITLQPASDGPASQPSSTQHEGGKCYVAVIAAPILALLLLALALYFLWRRSKKTNDPSKARMLEYTHRNVEGQQVYVDPVFAEIHGKIVSVVQTQTACGSSLDSSYPTDVVLSQHHNRRVRRGSGFAPVAIGRGRQSRPARLTQEEVQQQIARVQEHFQMELSYVEEGRRLAEEARRVAEEERKVSNEARWVADQERIAEEKCITSQMQQMAGELKKQQEVQLQMQKQMQELMSKLASGGAY